MIFRRLAPLLFAILAPLSSLGAEIDADLAALLASSPAGAKFGVIARLEGRAGVMRYRAAKASPETRRALVAELKERHAASARVVSGRAREAGGLVRRSLWNINALAVEGDKAQVEALATFPGVARLSLDRVVRRNAPPIPSAVATPPGWQFAAMNAGPLWEAGHKGAGALAAVLDSGVDMNHSAFAGGGWVGLSSGWFDPYGEQAEPTDDADAHGTMVASLVFGKGSDYPFGLAPEASWMVGRIYDNSGTGRLSAIHAALQWLLDPDENPLTDDAPQVVCNSWGFELDSGQCDREFQADIDLLAEAGMLVVFAGGNAGPDIPTDVSPANNANVLAVGATRADSVIAPFSGRGPNSCDGSTYPDLVAPGYGITAASYTLGGLNPNAVKKVNGTSFSAPLTAGAALLLKSALPEATMAEIGDALRQSASDKGSPGPDDTYGRGLVNVAAAYMLLIGCVDADGDGYFSGGEECGQVDCDDTRAQIHPEACDVPKDGIDQDCAGGDAMNWDACEGRSGGGGGGGADLLPGGCFMYLLR